VSNETLLETVLASALRDKTSNEWWEERGWDALRLFAKWFSGEKRFENLEPIPIDEPLTERRARLAAVLRLPTRKGWIPACYCYAGSAWDGPASFDDFFATIPDRSILLPSEKWPSLFDGDRDKWKRMLRWAGVSWEPKLLHYHSTDGASFCGSPDNPFVPISWPYWEKYCAHLRPESFDRRSSFCPEPKLTEQWALEFFPESFGTANEHTLSLMRPLTHLVNSRAHHMRYSYSGRDNDRKNGSVESLAYFQIHRHEWLRAKPSVLFPDPTSAPDATYMPGKSLYRMQLEAMKTQSGRCTNAFLPSKSVRLGCGTNLSQESLARDGTRKRSGAKSSSSDRERFTISTNHTSMLPVRNWCATFQSSYCG
jgi:hypothetical protein